MDMDKKAPIGQFRVIGRDSPQDEGWLKGDYPSLEQARKIATQNNGSSVRYRIYDEQGECISLEELS